MWNREVEGVEKGRISEFRPRGGRMWCQGLKRAEEGLTLPEVAPRSTQDHMASLWRGEGKRG